MTLQDIPQGSKLFVKTYEGDEEMVEQFATFHHCDGMYSYSTLDSDSSRAFHLSRFTPMKQVEDYYIIDSEESK